MSLRKILDAHNVSSTALLASYWKCATKSKESWQTFCIHQGERTKDLFKDSLMQHFIDDGVKAEAEERLDKRMWIPLAIRTRFFRQTISESIKNKSIKQVIILGSGFDTLPARKIKYSKDFGVKFFEVDQANILNCKKAIYEELEIEKNADYIHLDYVKENLIKKLKERDVDFTKPTLILWEGNTFYLEKPDAIRVLQDITTHFENPIITFDYMHAAMQESAEILDTASNEKSIGSMLGQFAQKKSPFKTFFRPDEIVALCKEIGLKCIANKTGAKLAVEYNVDKEPYYSSNQYSVATFARK